MSHISYFLPPYPTSPKAKLLSAIEYLESEECGGEILLLLAAIAESTVWSQECYERFIDVGMKAALELYDISTMNTPYEQTEKDPSNPRNWQAYKLWNQQST
ncbi:hypothetical protein H6S82_03575 [Planktothrix sp. FACHB-1355]|uniref:Uncharacterized protein n=1 Tax=Aerosakkonema funiforme FACHB-1375 TaxID=2949571 RepID=A0A926VBY1_9CYAN|nr:MULTISPECIES: hypothetical protein [Oscillatoriales]MBD2181036.1 hypothetical protein [Aerosakkonema funiforme FACHB-1375]MBD3557936.1 hypothetical protein [Planktothrix sp. FACHB-1355]